MFLNVLVLAILVITNSNLYIVITFIVNMLREQSKIRREASKDNEKFMKEYVKNKILGDIISILRREKELSIADLQRKTKLKRSTLIYYLNMLEVKGDIEKERIEEKQTGRPTMIRLKPERLSKIKKQEQATQKYMIDILRELKKRGEVKSEDLHTLLPYTNPIKNREESLNRLRAVSRVEFSNLSQKIIKITKEGEEYLNKHFKTSKPKYKQKKK